MSRDIHDIAKNIVVLMMVINGFEVFDRRVNVPSLEFVTNEIKTLHDGDQQ